MSALPLNLYSTDSGSKMASSSNIAAPVSEGRTLSSSFVYSTVYVLIRHAQTSMCINKYHNFNLSIWDILKHIDFLFTKTKCMCRNRAWNHQAWWITGFTTWTRLLNVLTYLNVEWYNYFTTVLHKDSRIIALSTTTSHNNFIKPFAAVHVTVLLHQNAEWAVLNLHFKQFRRGQCC